MTVKLLCLRLCEHDSSFCFFDGEVTKYIKLERIKGIKHFAYNDLYSWQNDFKSIFNESVSSLDEVAIIIDPWIYDKPLDENEFLFKKIDYLDLHCPVWRINHHYAHALSVQILTDRKSDIDIVLDGFGDFDQAWTVFKQGEVIEKGSLKKCSSIGIEMAQAGLSLNIKCENIIDVAGKLMSLQSYGTLSKDFLNYLNGYSIRDCKKLFDFKNWINFLQNKDVAELSRLDWIKTLHEKSSHLMLDFFKEFAKRNEKITFTGGVAQNIIWNTRLKNHFQNLTIPPHSLDDGLTLGGMVWLKGKNSLPKLKFDSFPYIQYDEKPRAYPSKATINEAANILANGFALGWYQGHGEIGPRALGNRSVLLDPRLENGKNIINEIKRRESYRPFGATVLYEFKDEYFDIEEDPYMLFVANIKNPSYLKSIAHIDNSCRVQTLKNENSIFRSLLERFHEITGCPILLNTSMNIAGKPLVGTIKDAETFFQTTNLKYLVVGNEILKK